MFHLYVYFIIIKSKFFEKFKFLFWKVTLQEDNVTYNNTLESWRITLLKLLLVFVACIMITELTKLTVSEIVEEEKLCYLNCRQRKP